jgi:hypothetical protein
MHKIIIFHSFDNLDFMIVLYVIKKNTMLFVIILLLILKNDRKIHDIHKDYFSSCFTPHPWILLDHA